MVELGSRSHSADVLIGKRLRRLRRERGYSVVQLSAQCGVDWAVLERAELGSYRLGADQLRVLCSAMCVDARELLDPTSEGTDVAPETRA